MGSLLRAVGENADASDFLAWPGDFELDRGGHGEEVHLVSGAALEGFAKDGSGGTYFFCGDGGEERPVLYADPEGHAALVAIGLPELLRLVLAAPWWQDAEREDPGADHLADMPDLRDLAARAATALGLDLPSETEALARLSEVVTTAGPGYVLVLTPENQPCAPLLTYGSAR
ncbi:hypothetical protein ABT154_30525 [Streptomyces sp. NPDC001728]|uniref:hypothetical protein n=1 Tax=Streptomyces sp. NPDC001728 TaxID=3154396 RepID=UPI0033171406